MAAWRKARRSCVLQVSLILAAGIIVYANTFHVPFVLDDKPSIVENADIRSLDNFQASQTRYVGYLTFALNYRFGGLDVTGYHVVNLVIHLGCALLVYALLRLTFRTPYFSAPGSSLGAQLGTGNRELGTRDFVPLFAALLFVAHPVQTQAVTYVVQRLTSLCTLFYLLSLFLYAQARLRGEPGLGDQGPGAGDRKPAAPWVRPGLALAGAVVSATIAMKTKEIAFTLPLAVALHEVFFFRGPWRRRLLFLLPLLATLPIVPLAVLSSGESAGDLFSDISEKASANVGMSRLDYLFTQFRVIVTYLRLLLLPVNQNLDYDYPIYTTFFSSQVFLSSLLLAALFLLALFLWWRSRPTSLQPLAPGVRLVAFGLLWFFLTLSVESSIIPIVDVIFEHRIYLPSFGAATAFAAAFALGGERFFPGGRRRWFSAIAALIVVALGAATLHRNHLWGDDIRLWQDVVEKSLGKGRPWNNLGVALEDAGRRSEAAVALARAIAVEPTYHRAYHNLADLHLVSGRPAEAIPLLQAAIRIKPDFTEAYVKMGAALIRGRQFREAAVFLERNLDRVANNAEGRFYLGAAYAFLGQREAALRELAVVSRMDPALAADLAGLLR